MNQKIPTSAILDFVRANPGASGRDIATHLGIAPDSMSGRICMMRKTGLLDSQVIGRTITNVPVFGHWAPGTMPPGPGVPATPSTPPRTRSKQATTAESNRSLDSLLDDMASTLVRALISRAKAQLPAAIAQDLMPRLTLAPRPSAQAAPEVSEVLLDVGPAIEALVRSGKPAAPVARLPRVGVVGLPPSQAGELTAEFSGVLELAFWTGQHPDAQLRALAKGCDAVFLHTRHAAHTVDAALTGADAKLYRVGGGVSQMKDKILAWCCSLQQA